MTASLSVSSVDVTKIKTVIGLPSSHGKTKSPAAPVIGPSGMLVQTVSPSLIRHTNIGLGRCIISYRDGLSRA